jgi:hypothetical protein
MVSYFSSPYSFFGISKIKNFFSYAHLKKHLHIRVLVADLNRGVQTFVAILSLVPGPGLS